jgi:hypothetical protein
VLTGMHQAKSDPMTVSLLLLQSPDNRGNFHEIGPGSGNQIDQH